MNTFSLHNFLMLSLTLATCCAMHAQVRLQLSELELAKPLHYRAYQTIDTIVVDGRALEKSWGKAPFTAAFVDIEGHPKPLQSTKVKMLWDKQYLYIYALLNENHIWASIEQRDAVIFHDNDFEVFIDPTDDTYNYTEIEINALNTVWDLMLNRPYRMKGWANTAYNIEGLKTAVHIQGSLNNSSDIDTAWSVEMAIPLQALLASFPPRSRLLDNQSIWRINFSRVQWQHELVNTQYRRKKVGGKLLPEYNWVWSPQHAINMHIPEKWGYLQFDTRPISDLTAAATFNSNSAALVAYALLRRVKFGKLHTLLKKKAGFQKSYLLRVEDSTYKCLFLRTFKGFEWHLINKETKLKFTIDDLGKFQRNN